MENEQAGTVEQQDDHAVVAALVRLHRGLARQGPGDFGFSASILASLPALPPRPRIADLGCGSGAATLHLAAHFVVPVVAVDLCIEFLEDLQARAFDGGLAELVRPVEDDIGALDDWPDACLDLLWSEGAAYNLGFEQALTRWRRLLDEGAIAVVSEFTLFSEEIPAEVLEWWREAYPGVANEEENLARARRAGYSVLATQRLPAEAWWRNYYGPLQDRIAMLEEEGIDEVMAAVIDDTEREMALFREHSAHFGYTFYVLQAA